MDFGRNFITGAAASSLESLEESESIDFLSSSESSLESVFEELSEELSSDESESVAILPSSE